MCSHIETDRKQPEHPQTTGKTLQSAPWDVATPSVSCPLGFGDITDYSFTDLLITSLRHTGQDCSLFPTD